MLAFRWRRGGGDGGEGRAGKRARVERAAGGRAARGAAAPVPPAAVEADALAGVEAGATVVRGARVSLTIRHLLEFLLTTT